MSTFFHAHRVQVGGGGQNNPKCVFTLFVHSPYTFAIGKFTHSFGIKILVTQIRKSSRMEVDSKYVGVSKGLFTPKGA